SLPSFPTRRSSDVGEGSFIAQIGAHAFQWIALHPFIDLIAFPIPSGVVSVRVRLNAIRVSFYQEGTATFSTKSYGTAKYSQQRSQIITVNKFPGHTVSDSFMSQRGCSGLTG